MEPEGIAAAFRRFISTGAVEGAVIDSGNIIHGTTAYVIRSFDRTSFQFSVPLIVRRDLLSEIGLNPSGSDGAVSLLIERIKEKAQVLPGLGPLWGKGIPGSSRYHDTTEPYTIVHSDSAIGSGLWKADERNYCDGAGIHLLVRGALPSGPCEEDPRYVPRALGDLARDAGMIVDKFPVPPLAAAWRLSLDQKLLRRALPGRGLVAFVGDDSHLARSFTRYRPFFRVAGPKEGVNVPFRCPPELNPVEVELAASNRTVTGLGIRMSEVFAVAGSNAQGKTTFLEGILAGMDDHALSDGRELVVTVTGACVAESTNMGLAGADISMFFHALPPGVSGTVHGAFGAGSGSMTMAHQIQTAIARRSPLLLIDEDRAAPNLLVRSCLQTGEITPLSRILSRDREKMGDTALLFAACALDELIAQADRIMTLEQHEPKVMDRAAFRRMLAAQLRATADGLELAGPYNGNR